MQQKNPIKKKDTLINQLEDLKKDKSNLLS